MMQKGPQNYSAVASDEQDSAHSTYACRVAWVLARPWNGLSRSLMRTDATPDPAREEATVTDTAERHPRRSLVKLGLFEARDI